MMIKRKDFYHKSIKYSFNWNFINHHHKLKALETNRLAFKRLASFFKKVCEGSVVPNSIFNSNDFPRVSQFKIKGLSRAYVRSLSKQLIRSGKITLLDKNHKLPKAAQTVYNTYKVNNINRKPGHDPVLKNILITDSDSLAIEVPIWKKFNEEFITGHIDLIQVEEGTLKIIDYKPEGRFLHSLPQVATYGLLIKRIFKIEDLKCVSFNKGSAWEYKPEILLNEIKDYLISQRIDDRKWEELF